MNVQSTIKILGKGLRLPVKLYDSTKKIGKNLVTLLKILILGRNQNFSKYHTITSTFEP